MLLAGYKPKVKLNPGEGLEKSLAEAEAIANAVKKGEKGTTQTVVESAKAASVIWNLADCWKRRPQWGRNHIDDICDIIQSGEIDGLTGVAAVTFIRIRPTSYPP